MAQDDRAIVVGINAYPGISEAVGAESDAQAFYAWLIDSHGGNVPENRVRLIVTSAFGTPPEQPEAAQPTAMQIFDAVQELLIHGRDADRIGRRLYLYFAGHGIASHELETALLMANAQQGYMGSLFHWLGDYTAELFRQTGYFDEILLFMDCCRVLVPIDAPNRPFGPIRTIGSSQQVNRFYAYATRWAEIAWARPLATGRVGGEFTHALLEGLNDAAYEPNSGGFITSASLKKYLLDRLSELKDSDFRSDNFVIAQIQPTEYPVTIHLPERTADMLVEIRIVRDGRFQVLHQITSEPPTWTLNLEKGLYEVQILEATLQQAFDVNGTGERHVEFE